jgi:small nuclear ribonucleoprotein (snRNP)-like protein
MIGLQLSVHLKDDRVLTGILDSVDADLSVTLGKCTGVFEEGPKRGSAVPMAELVFVAGKNVRFVKLPNNVDELLKRHWTMQRQVGAKQARRVIVDRPKRARPDDASPEG